MSDHLNTASEAGGSGYPVLQFDASEFLHFVKDENLTEAEATALLEAIWHIVVAFVDLGFGLHPVQHVRDKLSRDAFGMAAESSGLVSSGDQQFWSSEIVARVSSDAARRGGIHEEA